jgi:hypothetical protein
MEIENVTGHILWQSRGKESKQLLATTDKKVGLGQSILDHKCKYDISKVALLPLDH